MKKTLLYMLIGILITTGVFFAIRFEMNQSKAINVAYLNALRAVDFLEVEFPDQTADYVAKLKELNTAKQ